MRRADNVTTFTCQLSRNLGASSFAACMWFMPLFLFMLFLLVLWRLVIRQKGVFYSGWIEYFGGQGMYWILFNRLTPNDLYMSRTAPLTSKRCILYIYSTNIGTEYFKHALYSPFFSLQNAVCFIMLTCLVPVLFTFYIENVLKLKKIIPAPKS